jgi:hypothetical protein
MKRLLVYENITSCSGNFLAILVLITLGWAINGGYDTLKSFFLGPQPLWWQPVLLGMAPFSLMKSVKALP